MIIAIGKSRKDTRWHNADLTWDELKDRLRTPYRTRETYSEYLAMSKEQRGEVKDVGGFVGGRLSGGRRKKDAVVSRSLVTLDLDSARQDAWDNLAIWGWTCCAYSTHSHASTTPRLRFVLPLDREVTPAEYEPIARKVAEYIGIDQVDGSSYAPERLMYYPSCSSDGDWEWHEQDGELLCADEVLLEYGVDEAWRDSRLWPTAKTEATVAVKESAKQGNPAEKPGIVGLFCRTYDIPAAMERFIPGIYAEEESGRYTYVPGSTASGAVLYEDGAFLYSHHGTDPCCGQLVNAFDLVRIHKFRELDADCDPDTPITKRKSYAAMSELAAADDGVKKQMALERQQDAAERFGDLCGIDTPSEGRNATESVVAADTANGDDGAWAAQLEVNRKTGEADAKIQNAYLILKHDALLKNALAYNSFKGEIVARADLPWRKLDRGQTERGWTDSDDAELRRYLEVAWKFQAKDKLKDALLAVAHEREYDPLQTYLNSLTWDGVERLDSVLIDYFGADDTPYTRAITRKWFVAGIRRAYEPGCKFDSILVLIGEQGAGKSQFGAMLSKGWYCDSIQRIDNKDAYDQLQGVWIVELSELSATKKAENEQIKAFLSKTSDRYRKAYGTYTADYPRHCVFIGTTNDASVIKDETGGRRFWIVPLRARREDVVERLAKFQPLVDQLWAEAIVRYKSGEKTYEDTAELLAAAQEMQNAYTQDDELQGQLEAWLEIPIPEDWELMDARERMDYYRGADLLRPLGNGARKRNSVSIPEIRAEMLQQDLTREPGGPNNELCRHLSRLMNVMPGWEKAGRKRTDCYGQQRCYRREGTDA